jgi:archaellum component FlaC
VVAPYPDYLYQNKTAIYCHMSEQLNKLYEEYKKLNKESSYSRKSTSIPKMTPYKINIELEELETKIKDALDKTDAAALVLQD